MRVTTPEINWHNRDPVYSVDFCFRDNAYILATCGTDCFVRLWSAELAQKTEGEKVKVPTPIKSKSLKDGEEAEEEEVKINHRSTLVRHTKAVNVVRFSSDGRILASAGDDAVICLWRREKDKPSMVREEEEFNEEWWKVFKSLRGHLDDVYDLSWSKNGQFIVSGSIDNSAIIWNAKSGDKLHILREHKGLVQGVAWDPRNSHVATLSTDRCLRLFNVDKKFKCAATIFKMARKVAVDAKADAATSGDKKVDEQDKENASGSSKKGSSNSSSIRLYQDDTMKSFFRRPTFSPDGQLLVTPAGLWNEEDSKPTNAAFIYNLRTKEPAVRLPLHDKNAIAVRFCPLLFALRPAAIPKKSKGETESQPNAIVAKNMIDLPYRMVLAVATEDAIIIYDTQQTLPLGIVAGVHYHQLSDLSWSSDGRLLVVASTDGYVSTVSFDDGELGTPYAYAEAALNEVNSMVSIWKPKEEGTATLAPSSRKASSRASKTKAMEQNSKEISARIEAKAKIEKLEEKAAREKPEETEETAGSDEKVKTATATAVQPHAEDSKRRVQLTSLSSSSSGSSTFTSGSAPRRVGFMTLGANSSGADANPEAKDVVAATKQEAKAKSEAKPEQKRIQLQTLTSNSNVGEKSEDKKPRRVQLTSLVSKPRTDDEPMDT